MNEKPLDAKRSRSLSENRDMSINPFFNFLKDFKDSNGNTIKSAKELARVAGERWRTMSDADKSPYVNAAKEAKNKNPPKTENKPKEAKLEKAKKVVEKAKKVVPPKTPKRVCSRCGHREGSPVGEQVKVATRSKWRRKRGPEFPRREPFDYDDDDGDGGDTDDSRSRSRSDSGSKSRDSGASDSSATFY